MKTISKLYLGLVVGMFSVSTVYSQDEASLSPTYPPAKAVVNNPTAPASNTDMTITLKNSAEKPVAIFAGPKEEIRDPKLKTVGGLSKNTLYVQVNDVVCLMTDDKKPRACAVITPAVTTVEINTSATTIATK
ncbi:MAG TPA: hypothetical protein VG603_12005 [Chitinophagales bacterium]|nr:hypothetical protein [Chitinophagales bacterium]